MIEFDTALLTAWVMSFFWPLVRVLGFVAVAPIIGDPSVPVRIKVGLACMLTVVLMPMIPAAPDISPFSFAGVWLIAQQILVGAALGLVMRVVFAAVQAAGAFIGLQMGLGFATFFNAATGTNTTVLSRALNLFAVLMFVALDGHIAMLQILATTFQALPIGGQPPDASAWHALTLWGGTIFSAGAILALPLIIGLLAMDVCMGILNRASPQFTIFSIGLPIKLISGILLLVLITPQLDAVYSRMFGHGLKVMTQLILLMGGQGG